MKPGQFCTENDVYTAPDLKVDADLRTALKSLPRHLASQSFKTLFLQLGCLKYSKLISFHNFGIHSVYVP